MIHVTRGELIKTVTTRTVVGFAAMAVALAVANVLIMTLSEDLVTAADKQEAIAGLPIMLVLFGLVGAAGEYRHGTAAPAAFAAGRGRGRLVLARAGAYALTGTAVGALAVAFSLAVGLPLLGSEPGPGLGAGDVAVVAAGSVIAGALCAITGVAVGAIVRNQVVGVVGALILAFVVTPLLYNLDATIVEFTPFGAAMVLAGDPTAETLSVGEAALVLAAWTLPLLVGAVAAERGRDLA